MSLAKPIPARKRLARNLLDWRMKRGLSQETLSASADLTQSFYSQLENGRRNVSLDTLERLAKELRIDVLDLLAN